jgi:hypothetical protein
MQKLGGMGGIMGMMPGMGKMKDQMSAAGMDDKTFARQLAIIGSMTKAERANPDMLKHSRKKRIAAGSGTDAAAINKLLKMHRQMADMMKAMGGKGKGGGMMRAAMGGLAQKWACPAAWVAWAACRICRRWTRSSSKRCRSRRRPPASARPREWAACLAGFRVECRAACPDWVGRSCPVLAEAAFPACRRRSEGGT